MRPTFVLLSLFLRSHLGQPWRLAVFMLGLAAPTLLVLAGLALSSAVQDAAQAVAEDYYLVLQSGAGVESRSFFPQVDVNAGLALIESMPGVRLGEAWSAVTLDARLEGAGTAGASAMVRGVEFDLQTGESPAARLLSGRLPHGGAREAAVSPSVFSWLRTHSPRQDVVTLAGRNWKVVGVAESTVRRGTWDIFTSAEAVRQSFGVSGMSSSVTLRMPPSGESSAKTGLAKLRDQSLELVQYRGYVERSTAGFRDALATMWRGCLVLVVLCTVLAESLLAGAIAMERSKAHATLAAVGFSEAAIDGASMLEGAILGALGSAVAVAAGWAALRGFTLTVALPGVGLDLALAPDTTGAFIAIGVGCALGAGAFVLRRTIVTRAQ